MFDTTDRIIKSLKEKNIITTRTDINIITYYDVNLEQLNNLLNGIYLVAKRAFTKVPKQHCVSKTTITNLVSGLEPKNAHFAEAQISMIAAQETLSPKEMTAVMTTSKDEAYARGLEISLLTALALTNIIQI
ncbi:hypothetical protein BWK67_09010 [Campylobacter fetus]|nr:hypothetical protein BWK67_09010 [Campylobacter fetus]RUT48992.1 hypothetical protein BWK51_08985 [Campylobacter fetus]